ncbi:MAG: DEAD/DEAH box helicase [Methylococcaceae bacterium]
MSFTALGLNEELLKAISDQGYTKPTPVQQQAIPHILAGKDVLAGAQTGTGKTAGFTLPLLQRLMENHDPHQKPRRIRALVLVPTRELAAQVFESIKTYGAHLPLVTEVIIGGASINMQIRQLQRGCDIVVATTGRLCDHMHERHINLNNVEILVLDEADRMLDMGFLPDIKRITGNLPKQRQTLLFSATYSSQIKALAAQLLNNPVSVEVAKPNVTSENISELVYGIARENKRALLSYLIGSNNWQQVLVFVRTKHGADRLEKQLTMDGIRSAALHGDKTQGARTKALDFFKNGKVSVLVATDIAARGLDIDNLPHVVNYDLPQVPEDYIHRIGRTGRAGSSGAAISLVSPEESQLLFEIEKLLKRHLPQIADTGYEAVSLKVADMPKKVVTKEGAKKDLRHTKPSDKKGYVARNQAPNARPKTQGSRSRSR